MKDEDLDLTYISFGGGVQSTALLAMSALGLHGVPKADCAVFADTKGEVAATYRHIEAMKAWSEKRGIPLHIVTEGSLEDDVLVGKGQSHVSIPAFIKVRKTVPCPSCVISSEADIEEARTEWISPKTGKCMACGGKGSVTEESRGIQRRQCTWDYKIMPILKKVRELCGLKKGARAKGVLNVRAMIGISFDEIIRMKPSREEWIENSYPLVDARLSREDCKKITAEVGLTVPPRSSCWFCPHHSDRYWRWLKSDHPVEFQRAIEFDVKLRHSQPNLVGESFLHGKLVPLSEVDLNPNESQRLLDGFGNACEGVCGV